MAKTTPEQRQLTPAEMLADAVTQAKAKQSPEERMADYGAWYIDSLAADRDDVFLKKQSERLFGVEMPEDRLEKDRSVFNKAREFVDMYSRGQHVTEKGDEFLTSIPKEQQDDFLRALQAVGTKQDVDTEGLSRVSRRLTRGMQQVGTSTAKFMDQFGLLPEYKGKSAEEVIDFSRNVQGALAGMDPAKAESWLGEAGLKAAEMFPAMAVSTLGGMKGIGQRAGNWAFWTAQTQPQQEWLMEEHNVDPETAKLWSWIGGMASAAVEQLGSAQLRGVKPSNPTLRNFVKENLIEWGAKEWLGEEGSQAMIELAADAIARKTGGGDPMDWDKEFHAKLTELMETGAPLAILMGPGAAVRGAQTYGEAQQQKAQGPRGRDVRPEQEPDLSDEEASRLLDTFAKEAEEPPTTQRTEIESQGRPEDLAKEPGWEETPARPERVRDAQQRLTQLEAMMEKGYVAKEEAQQAGIPGENRKERLANAQQEAARLRQEIEDAREIPEDQAVAETPGEVRQRGETDRGRDVQQAEEAGAEARDTEVQVAPTEPEPPQEPPAAQTPTEVAQPQVQPGEPEAPPTDFEERVRQTVQDVPAWEGADVEVDETNRRARIRTPSGHEADIYFDADEIVDEISRKQGRKPGRAKGAYAYRPTKGRQKLPPGMYLRSNATHDTLNHEAVHWMEDQGIITEEEVQQHGGREGVANEYQQWIRDQNRKPNNFMERIRKTIDWLLNRQSEFREWTRRTQTKVPEQQPPAPEVPVEEGIADPHGKLEQFLSKPLPRTGRTTESFQVDEGGEMVPALPNYPDLMLRRGPVRLASDEKLNDAITIARVETEPKGEGYYRKLHDRLLREGKPLVVEQATPEFGEMLKKMGYEEDFDPEFGREGGVSWVFREQTAPQEGDVTPAPEVQVEPEAAPTKRTGRKVPIAQVDVGMEGRPIKGKPARAKSKGRKKQQPPAQPEEARNVQETVRSTFQGMLQEKQYNKQIPLNELRDRVQQEHPDISPKQIRDAVNDLREQGQLRRKEISDNRDEIQGDIDSRYFVTPPIEAGRYKEPTQPAPVHDEDTAFAQTVQEAANSAQEGRFGGTKVFISHLWRQVKDDPNVKAKSYQEFQQKLVDAHKKGLLGLSQADLVEAMDKTDVAESETPYQNMAFHFVRTSDTPRQATSTSSYRGQRAKEWLQNAVQRRPADKVGNDPAQTAKWIKRSFSEANYQQYLDDTGKNLEAAVGEFLPSEGQFPKRKGRKDQGTAEPAPTTDYPQMKKEDLRAEVKRRKQQGRPGFEGWYKEKKDGLVSMLEQDDRRQEAEAKAEAPTEPEASPAPKPGTKPSSTDYMQQMVDQGVVRKEDAQKKSFSRDFRNVMPNNRWLSLPEIAGRFRNEKEGRDWARRTVGSMVESGLLDRMYRSDGTPVYAWKGAEAEEGLLTQAEADQKMPTEAPAEPEAPPTQETRREPTRQRADRPRTETISELGETGATSNLNLADNTSQTVQYVAVDANQVTPSHDARRNFARNEEGDWNERPYHDPVEGASSRATVEQIAQADPGKLSLLVSDNTTPTDGPAMTTPDGVVLGGNARAMAIQLAYQRGGEAAQRMKQTMVDAAQKFGMDPDAVKKMDRPIIVRVLSKVGDRGEMSAILNESLTAGKSQATVAASRGTRVGQNTAELISQYMAPRGAEDGRSLRDVLSDPKRSRRVIDRMRNDGVFTQKDLDQYLDSEGMLNDEGKLAVEQALLGRVIADPSTLGDMAKSTRRTTLSAIGPLVRIMSDPTHGERFTEIIRNTIASLPSYSASGLTAQQYYITQRTLTDQPGHGDPAVGILADAIRTRGPVQFRKAIDEVARSLGLKSDTGGQMSMFETTQRAESVDVALENQFGSITGRFGADVSQGPGITPTVPLTDERGGIGRSVRHFFQRFFTSRGELPEAVYKANIRREGRIARQMNELRNAAVDFRRGIRKALGGQELTQADVERMNAVLRGEADPTTVPAEVRQPIKVMRDHIDALSRRLISAGVAQGDLVGIITDNMGVYTTRSYRVFTDPKWRNKVPDPIRNRALAAIRELYPDASDAERIGILESLLFRGAADSPVALLRGSKLGSKDLGIFMRRQDIPQWLRELWGEYKEPGVNYARSIFKMSHLWANHQFLNEVREAGLDTWLRSEEDGPIVNEFGEVITQIAAEGSSVMAPLNGMYTTPEIKRAFEGLDAAGSMPEWLRVLMGVNYAVKYGKTVGSAMTHVRNTVSNIGFMIQNGHWRIGKAGKAIWATATGTFQLPDAEFREYYNRLVELKIVGEDVRAGELKDALRDANQTNNIDEFLYNREARHAKKATQAGRATVRFMNALYQAEDGVAKIYGFENEKARYAKAHPEWSQQQLEEHCADIVRNTYPTYSKIPTAVKAVRRFPLIGPFVSFTSEVARTTFHSVKLGYNEMQAPETRGIGAQRLAGNIAAMGAIGALARGTMALFGIGDDEDEDLRWFVPPWQENSQFLYTAKPKGSNYWFVDLGYTDPHTYLKAPVHAFLRGDNWKDRLGQSAAEALAPFTNEEILSSALMDLRSNEDNKVYNPKDEVGEQAKDIVAHMWTEALEPGTISSVRRIHEAATGRTPRLGLKTEIAALFTGFRFQKVDVEHSLGFRVRDFGKALTDIQRIARKTATTRGTATGEMVATDKARMERLRLAEFAEMQRIIGAARRCGVPRDNLESMLKDNLPDDVAQDLMTGDYSQYELSPQTVRRMMAVVRPPDWEKTADVAVKYPKEFKEYQEAFMERFVGWHGDKAAKAAQEYVQHRLGSLPYKEPSREDYDTDRKYAKAMKEHEEEQARIKHELELLAMSHEEAQEALVQSFRDTTTKGEKITEFVKGTKGTLKEDLKPSYMGRAKTLAEFYGKPDWREWRRPFRKAERAKKDSGGE